MLKFVTVIVFILLLNNAYSQHAYQKISGTIKDENNTPIPYVSIQVDSTYIGTISNQDGQFELKIPIIYKNHKLKFYCIGYTVKTCKIKPNLTITLNTSPIAIDEITVTPIKPLDLLKNAIEEIPHRWCPIPSRSKKEEVRVFTISFK